MIDSRSRVEDILNVILGNLDSSVLQPPQSRVEALLQKLNEMISDFDGKIPVHICTSGEYDHETLMPTIEDPEENAFYLVPANDSGDDMYIEWIFTEGNRWERFGSGGGTVQIKQSDWNQNDSSQDDFIKNKPDLTLKLDKNQGAANSGKFMGVNSSGNVVPLEVEGGNIAVTEELVSGEDYELTVEEGETGSVISVAGKTGTVTLNGNDVVFNDAASYNDGTIGGTVADLKSQTNALGNSMEAVTGVLNNASLQFEIGNITVSTSTGITYSSSTKRVRTAENYFLVLSPGDVIKLKDYTKYRMYIGFTRPGGTYGSSGAWKQEDYICQEFGYYVFVVTDVPEKVIDDLQTVVDQIVIERVTNLANNNCVTNVHGINHMGFNWVAPENTMPAYVLSKEMGFSYVETDISMTSDNVPVLLHDDTINRTARNADGTSLSSTVNISDITYEEALEYDFGIWKSPTYAGTKIPTFEQFIAYCKYAGLHPYCELKGTIDTVEKAKTISDIVIAYGMQNNVTFISFSNMALTIIKESMPTVRLGMVASTYASYLTQVIADLKTSQNKVFLSLSRTAVTDANVAECIANGIELEAYVADTYGQVTLMNPYVTGITTNVVNVPAVLSSYAKRRFGS